jgi:hypothetical protein
MGINEFGVGIGECVVRLVAPPGGTIRSALARVAMTELPTYYLTPTQHDRNHEPKLHY